MAYRYRTKSEEVIAIQVPGADASPEDIQEFMAWIFEYGAEGNHRHWTVSSGMEVELSNGEEGEKVYVSEGDYMVKNAHGAAIIRAMTERAFSNQFVEIDAKEEHRRTDALNLVKDIAMRTLDGEEDPGVPDGEYVLENDTAVQMYGEVVAIAKDIVNG